jgi:hypothetical protein
MFVTAQGMTSMTTLPISQIAAKTFGVPPISGGTNGGVHGLL